MIDQITALETRGFFREQYRERDTIFHDWNYGVWQHRWNLVRNSPCRLCGSTDPAVEVSGTSVCLKCLNEFPLVPWHPTGAIRPKTRDFLTHATDCAQHTQT